MAATRDECLVTITVVLVCHSEQRRTREPFQGKTCTLLVKVSKLHIRVVFQEYLTCIFTFTLYIKNTFKLTGVWCRKVLKLSSWSAQND